MSRRGGASERGVLVRRYLSHKPLTAGRASRIIATATLAIVLVAGLLMRAVEPSTFPNIWLGLWWSVQTVTSVGYGDIVPTSPAGRILALLVMINGIAFLTVVIAAISAVFVEAGRRRHAREDPAVAALAAVEERLAAIERRLEAVAAGDGRRVDAPLG